MFFPFILGAVAMPSMNTALVASGGVLAGVLGVKGFDHYRNIRKKADIADATGAADLEERITSRVAAEVAKATKHRATAVGGE